MVQAVREVPEAEATGKIKDVYDDIKVTLRIPVVGLQFRALAVNADYLQVAWIALKPNVQTVFFEACADQLRAFAVRSLPAQVVADAPSAPEAARAALDIFHYMNPKLLLTVAALRSAAYGQQPRLLELTRDEKRQIVPGIPPGVLAPATEEPVAAPGSAGDLSREIETTLQVSAVPDQYRALAPWPDYLRDGWEAIQRLMAMREYDSIVRKLRLMAEETVAALPYRMDISPHVLRQSGLSERDLDEVHHALDIFYGLLPGEVVATSLLSAGSAGPDAASRSPYPIQTG